MYSLVAKVEGLDSLVFTARALDPNGLAWYHLESIALGSTRYQPEEFYVQQGDLALSPSGYYVEDVLWTSPPGWFVHDGGPYKLSNSVITLPNTGDHGMIGGDSLLIGRNESDFDSPVTWIYRLRKTE